MIKPISTLLLVFILSMVKSDRCPDNRDCPEACCPTSNSNSYSCCPRGVLADQGSVYVTEMGSIWKNYWGLFLGLFILGLIISIIVSILCCLYCNGCLGNRRGGRDIYAGAFPLGTLIYSPHLPTPPAHRQHPPAYYDDFSDSSIRSGRNSARPFDHHDTMAKSYDTKPNTVWKKTYESGW